MEYDEVKAAAIAAARRIKADTHGDLSDNPTDARAIMTVMAEYILQQVESSIVTVPIAELVINYRPMVKPTPVCVDVRAGDRIVATVLLDEFNRAAAGLEMMKRGQG